jgi:hypothetical protein
MSTGGCVWAMKLYQQATPPPGISAMIRVIGSKPARPMPIEDETTHATGITASRNCRLGKPRPT